MMWADLMWPSIHPSASTPCSGVVASSFRILRQVLDRLEDVKTGQILPPFLSAEIPAFRIEQTKRAAEVLGDLIYKEVRTELH